MCECCGCQNPEKDEKQPETCTPEQIEECHGSADEHPCCGESE